MSIDVWTPLRSMDDDRLVLEAAAVLSLFSPKKIGMLNHILGGWVEIGGGFEMGSPDGNEKIRLGLTAESIRMTGLELPSDASCAHPAAAIEECASLFIRSAAEPEPPLPHIALAFLNLYASISAGQPDWDGLANTGMVWDAWRCVRDFLIGLPNAFQAGTGQSETQTTGCGPCNSAADPWISGLDSMFKILNSADSLQSMPPRPTGEETLEWAAYWAPLPTLTVGLLGWSDPALGVARWILKGMPATTPERALLRKTWGTDTLMFFCHPKKDWDPSDGQGLALVHSGLAIADIYELSDRSRDFIRCGELNMSVIFVGRWLEYSDCCHWARRYSVALTVR